LVFSEYGVSGKSTKKATKVIIFLTVRIIKYCYIYDPGKNNIGEKYKN